MITVIVSKRAVLIYARSIKLQESYETDAIFEILETGEEITLSDFRYNADWNDFEQVTIQHI